MERLTFLTIAQMIELDRMCKAIADAAGWGRVSVVIENGRPRWVETAISQAMVEATGPPDRPPPMERR